MYTLAPLSPAHLLTSQQQLAALVEYLQNTNRLALDTESNSMFVYRAQVCLIQLSSQDDDFLLDPLCIEDLSPLDTLMSNPNIEKVVHGAEYDVIALKRDYHFTFSNIFDTALAARVLGITKHGLGSLTKAYFGITLDKYWQRADWGKRPFSKEQIEYARLDTRYLLPLREVLHDNLVEQGAWAEAQELFTELEHLHPQPEQDPFWAIANAHPLRPKQLTRLRELYQWRENLAQAADIPPTKVLTNEMMLKIARHNPHTLKELSELVGVSGRWLRVNGKDIQAALDRARQSNQLHLPKRQRTDPQIHHRHDLLKEWRKERAKIRGVASDVVLPNDLMWEIAKADPHTLADLGAQLGPWRLTHYGEDILRLLSEGHPQS